MRHDPIIITGATGNLGGKLAQALMERQQPIVVTGRNADKLSAFQHQAKTLTGDLEDPDFLTQLFKEGKSVFLVMPSLQRLSIKAFAEQFISLAEANGVSHVVNISNCTLKRWGQPTSLIEFETYLNKAQSLNIKHLRCANFFENLNWGIHTPYRPDIKLPYISSYEIVQIAAEYLTRKSFSGCSVDELLGAQDYSMSDIANKLGITYQQIPARPEDQLFFDAFNSGEYELVERTPANTSVLQDERFTLSYFLKHHLNPSLLKP